MPQVTSRGVWGVLSRLFKNWKDLFCIKNFPNEASSLKSFPFRKVRAGGGTDLLYEPREGQPGFFGNFDIDTHHPPDWYPYQSGFCFQKLTPTPKRLLQTHTNFKSLRKNEHPPPKTRIKIKIIYFLF